MAETEIVSKKCGQGKLKAVIERCYASSALWHIADLPFAPVDLKRAAALSALVRLFAHRIVHTCGEQYTAVRVTDRG